MGEEDWISSRNKIPKFDEYMETWMQKLVEFDLPSPVIESLKIQIESYKVKFSP